MLRARVPLFLQDKTWNTVFFSLFFIHSLNILLQCLLRIYTQGWKYAQFKFSLQQKWLKLYVFPRAAIIFMADKRELQCLSKSNTPSILHVNSYNFSEQLYELNIIFIPILHLRKLTLTQVKQLVQDWNTQAGF